MSEQEKGKSKAQVAALAHTQVTKFAPKFGKEFSLVSCLFYTLGKDAWIVDSRASRHMRGLQDVFTSIIEEDSKLHVELGDDAKYNARGTGEI